MILRRTTIAFLSFITLLISGLALSDEWLETGDDAATTYDGLKRIKKSVADEAYINPDIDLSGFTSVIIDLVDVPAYCSYRSR